MYNQSIVNFKVHFSEALKVAFNFQHLAIDPRSPSTGVNRTPIVVESPLLSSEDSDTPKKVPEAKAPKRGMFANALASH
jgi:hypothetical protein